MRCKRRAFVVSGGFLASLAMVVCTPTAGAITKSCGPNHMKKASGGDWVCSFGDSFNGQSLNRANWGVMRTAAQGFTQAGECYVDDPSHVRVANGKLFLTATRLPHPTWCGLIRSSVESGLVFTQHHFAQAYGRFKIRAKMPSGTGLQSAFWMWPEHKAYAFRSGEIDIAEDFGSIPETVAPHVHMKNAIGADQGQGAYCHVADPAGTFHNYLLVWLPNELKFKYDGVTCMDISNWDPGWPLKAPQPFDQPFFMILQLALGSGSNAVNSSTPFPASMVVDYVRAWH
jgi:beta-glucanase (GH16 family)